MAIIKNKEELLSHGNKIGRKIALDIIENALRSIDSYEAVKKIIRIERERRLTVGNLSYDLSKIQNIYVVGGGKATFQIAQALDEILGELIKKGVVNVKKGEGRKLKHIKVIEAGHPIPDEKGLEGAKEIVEIAKAANEQDLVFVCTTGGASALMPLPAQGISLEDKKRVTDHLLRCGATIDEINIVRKHISAIKGGRLATYIHPAKIVNLIVVDEVAGLPWGPTIPDSTTFEDAIFFLKKYNIWDKVPSSVRYYLENKDPRYETPKEKDFLFQGIRAHTFILANNESLCEAAKRRAEDLGFKSAILSTVIEGESREAGIVLACIGKEIERHNRPIKPPCVLISGGETTVTIEGQSGEGGRNQELTLGFSMKIDGHKNITMSAIGTDGTDGPTDIAGGIADGYTLERAKRKGIDIFENLMKHDSSYVLRKLGDAIYTGPTGTNVMDLHVIVITADSTDTKYEDD